MNQNGIFNTIGLQMVLDKTTWILQEQNPRKTDSRQFFQDTYL